MDLSPTDMIAGLALLVACVAAWTTWRIHKDSGGRVQVQMNAAAYFPYAGTGRLERSDKGKFFLKESPEPSVELAQIIIENPGRTGVTVTGVGLRIEGLTGRITRSSRRDPSFSKDMGDRTRGQRTTSDSNPMIEGHSCSTTGPSSMQSSSKDPSLRELTIRAEVTVAGHSNPFDFEAPWVLENPTRLCQRGRRTHHSPATEHHPR